MIAGGSLLACQLTHQKKKDMYTLEDPNWVD